jgi:hypothetical protein
MAKTPARRRVMLGAAATTGHADSPATVVIRKKKSQTPSPKALPRKGRKDQTTVRNTFYFLYMKVNSFFFYSALLSSLFFHSQLL